MFQMMESLAHVPIRFKCLTFTDKINVQYVQSVYIFDAITNHTSMYIKAIAIGTYSLLGMHSTVFLSAWSSFCNGRALAKDNHIARTWHWILKCWRFYCAVYTTEHGVLLQSMLDFCIFLLWFFYVFKSPMSTTNGDNLREKNSV